MDSIWLEDQVLANLILQHGGAVELTIIKVTDGIANMGVLCMCICRQLIFNRQQNIEFVLENVIFDYRSVKSKNQQRIGFFPRLKLMNLHNFAPKEVAMKPKVLSLLQLTTERERSWTHLATVSFLRLGS